jgi:ABC-type nitrate/sulfonate/bicarbonate transport system ATPase subunit
MTAISISGVRKSYDKRIVVDDINLEIQSGEFVSIVGPSGGGKSTLLYCIAGFCPFEGRIERPRRIGFVFQDHALYPFMTCRDNVALGLGHLASEQRREKVDEYLNIIGLPDCGEKYPWQLSGGESQRLAIARAFAPEPEVVLMDEPLSALDVMRREAMLNWLMTFLRNRPTTIVMVTHWIDEAIIPSSRVVVLSEGAVMAQFPVDLPQPRNDQTKDLADFIALRQDVHDCIFTNQQL